MANSPLERINQLDQERAQLIASAKEEALGRANSAIADLHTLGFSYRLVEGGRGERRASPRGTRAVRNTACPVCKFQTSPPHDGRRHRAQGERKRPFTDKELKEMKMQKA